MGKFSFSADTPPPAYQTQDPDNDGQMDTSPQSMSSQSMNQANINRNLQQRNEGGPNVATRTKNPCEFL